MRIFVDRLASRGIAARSLAAATMAIAGLGFLMASPAVAQLPPPLAAVEPLGAGTTGAAGVPELKVLGYEALDQPGAGLRLFHGAPLAPAQIVLSLAIGPTPLPGYGAQLWPAAPFTRWTTALDAQGVSPVFHSGPAPAPAALAGMDLIAQGLVVDAVAQGGAAFTAGVRVHVGAGTSAARLFPFAGVSLEGDGKSAVATGDVDGDGRPDIVTVAHELTDFSVRVLRQLSDGTFAPPLASPFPGKGIIKDMELADLTADGRLDAIIAVPTAVPSALVLLPGLGDGEFGAPQVITAPSAVPWIAAGDVTGDGLPDVVAPGWMADVVAVLPGLPGGGLGAPVLLPAAHAEFTVGVQLADADGDGHLDVLLVHGDTPSPLVNSALVVLRSLGGGAFAPAASMMIAAAAPTALAVGDLDGDGAPDAAVLSSVPPALVTLLNDGTGAYPTEVPFTGSVVKLSAHDVAIADLDGDGQGEVLVAPEFSAAHVISLQHVGGGTLGDPADLGVVATALSPADMDGDGALDFVGVWGGIASFSRGLGDGTLASSPSIPDFASVETVAADLDADGVLDLVGLLEDHTLAVVLGDGHGGFGAPASVDAGDGVQRFATGDLDGDGKPEIVATMINLQQIAVLRGLGGGAFGTPEIHATSELPLDVQLADVTHDGRPDVVVSQHAALVVFATLANGSLAAPTETPTGGPWAFRIALGDIDRDGQVDVVAHGKSGLVFRGTGTPAFLAPVAIPSSTALGQALDSPLALGDLDGDGDLDLVDSDSGWDLILFFNDGAGGFTEVAPPGPTFPAHELTIADVNADGAPDIVGGRVLLGFGDGTFTEPAFGPDGAHGDFDGDGDLDFAHRGIVYLNTLY